ncbi:WblT protein [Herbaspirillum sp. BH-1]|uniref:Glycosyltransferase involved in cell wall biosynthesis n=1 Tax=Herbaspirillum frisingense TaxID=92645 RepID=A0ABU1PLP8_9BURK|nr:MULTISPECIES: glycosyltransferase family 2 protein [Herbaspirillum]MDR6586838.1 glycosyltransferase involved in cell wall biosynthesis [Herbaspirillum frisingense]PLY58100.1 WblT protein [Herbaspirillum sp. BH-1]
MNRGSSDCPQGPSLSVILCVHRANPWLQHAIDSVLEQSDGDFEFLIAANACSDEFWEQLQAVGRGDPRIRLIRTSIGQLAFNLNVLADMAHGQYLVRMDADDVCAPTRIATLRAHLANDPLDILGSAVCLIDGHGHQVGLMQFPESREQIVAALKRRTVFCHPAVAIRRQFLLEMRGYLGGFHSEDTDLWLRASRHGARMANLPDVLLSYRLHDSQSISSGAGYAEVSAHWLREFLSKPGWYTLQGLMIALGKAVCKRFLPRGAAYRQGPEKQERES